MNRMTTLFTIAAMVGLLAAASASRAQDPNTGQSDLVLINGAPVAPFPFLEGQPEFAPAFFPAPPGPDLAVVFYEDVNQTIVSDQIWRQAGFLYFASDPDLQDLVALNIPVAGTLVETGLPQDVSGFFGAPPGSIQVISDVVPEPSTLVLAGIGLVSVGLSCWRRRRTGDCR